MRDRKRGTVRDLRRENRAAVLWSLYLSQPRSRHELGAATGLSAASVTSVIRELIDEGIVIETGLAESDGGRPRAMLGMNPQYGYVIGVDIGETRTRVELFDLTMTERAKAEFSPSAMMFVGVAGGLRDWLTIGDVIVATKIYSYQGGRSENDEFLIRPRSWDASHRIDQAARRLSRLDAWYDFLPEDATKDRPKAYFEPIAVGDVLLNSTTSDLAQRLRQSYNDAVAV